MLTVGKHNNVITKSKAIQLDQQRSERPKPHPQVKQVNLGHQNTDAPEIAVYQCMVDEAWYLEHAKGTIVTDEMIVHDEEFPLGFEVADGLPLSRSPSPQPPPSSSAPGSP